MAPGDVCHGPRCSLAGLGPAALEYRSCHWPGGSAGSPQCVRPMGCWFFPVPRPPYVCAVSWATWLLCTGVPARCVVLRVRCPGPPGSCSPVCPLGVLFCVCGVLGLLAPVHRCARSVCCVGCAVSWACWLLFSVCPSVATKVLLVARSQQKNNTKLRKRRTASKNKAKNVFRPQKPPKKFYAPVWRGRKI